MIPLLVPNINDETHMSLSSLVLLQSLGSVKSVSKILLKIRLVYQVKTWSKDWIDDFEIK